MRFDLSEHSQRRLNPLTGEWVIVSPHRAKRPWQGQVEETSRLPEVRYDPTCYLCPGNERAGGKKNPVYNSVFVFDNDFAALTADVPSGSADTAGLIVAESERGVCRVVCFSPDHALTLSRMRRDDIKLVVDDWSRQYDELGEMAFINHVQIFENRGEMMGASNPHPHCQIWASESIPNEPAKEYRSQVEYYRSKNACLLCDYLEAEDAARERVVLENDHFTAVVPFWAVYPFEVMILSKAHRDSVSNFDEIERLAFADILKRLTTRYDNLFQTPFPYSMGFHQKPTDGAEHKYHHFHAHFYPPLLRSATVRKFLVGFEILGSPQRDITPESAAERLRELSEKHYLDI
ncbi:MAG: UDP-glucose--hexose-1-phosphate uridylyltransferase [Pyrinomonadaceae bacterium]